MEKQGEKKPAENLDIDRDGDVILVVGPEKSKIRVHSLFLKTALKPFSAMFGPGWKEGHDILDRDGPIELVLPEDNASALQLICIILHHQNNKLPQTLPATDILRVAITADKFDFVRALMCANENWLRPDREKADDFMLLAASAYLFQNTQTFKNITRLLMLIHKVPYLDLLCEEVKSTMTWKVFALLEEQRSYAWL